MTGKFRIQTILTALILFVPCSQALGQSASSSLFDLTTSPRSYKDPVVAFKMAFFPGFFIHGRGHIYAQQKTLATALMTVEVISLMAIGLGFWENNKPNDFANFPGNGGSAVQAQDHGKKLITYGSLIFVLGWIVDMAHAPAAADRYNTLYDLKPIVRAGPQGAPEVFMALNRRF